MPWINGSGGLQMHSANDLYVSAPLSHHSHSFHFTAQGRVWYNMVRPEDDFWCGGSRDSADMASLQQILSGNKHYAAIVPYYNTVIIVNAIML